MSCLSQWCGTSHSSPSGAQRVMDETSLVHQDFPSVAMTLEDCTLRCLCLGLMSSRHPIVNSRETCVLSDLTEHLKKFLRMELLPHLPGVVIDVCSPCCGVPPPLMRDCSRFRRTKCVTFLWTSIPQSGAVISDRERGLGFANLALFVVSGLHLATISQKGEPRAKS